MRRVARVGLGFRRASLYTCRLKPKALLQACANAGKRAPAELKTVGEVEAWLLTQLAAPDDPAGVTAARLWIDEAKLKASEGKLPAATAALRNIRWAPS